MANYCSRRGPAGASTSMKQLCVRVRPSDVRTLKNGLERMGTVDFSGKVAVITGGGGDIGRASALGFAARGAKVVVVDINEDAGKTSAELICQQGGEARFVRADVS